MMKSTVLSARHVRKSYGGVLALNDVELSLEAGDILGVIGPNGAGKSTLIDVLSGATRPDSGQVALRGRDVTGRRPHVVCRMGLSRTFQIPRPFAELSVTENVRVPFGRGRRHSWRSCEEIVEFCGLQKQSRLLPSELTHADQRKLEIARAVASEPAVIMLDEPGAGLTEPELEELRGRIIQLREQGIAILLVDHVMTLVMGVCPRVLVLDSGTKIAEGTPAEIANDRAVVEAYLGVEWN